MGLYDNLSDDELQQQALRARQLPSLSANGPIIASPSARPPVDLPQIGPKLPSMQSLEAEQDRLTNPQLPSHLSGVDQFSQKHHILGPMLKTMDVMGSIFAPGISAAIPGTTMHHRELVGENAEQIGEQEAQRGKQAQVEHENAETGEIPGRKALTQAQTEHTQAETKALGQPDATKKVIHETDQGVFLVDPTTGETTPLTYQGKPLMPKSNNKPDTETEEAQHFEAIEQKIRLKQPVTPEEKAWHDSYKARKLLGPSLTVNAANDRQDKAENFQTEKEARGQINKAAQTYRTAKAAGDALDGFINLAKSGNKVASATVPLEGTLEIVTSQGVKRINKTEVEGVAGAGNLWDQIQAKVGKMITGQAMPPDLLRDFEQLNSMLHKNAYQQYSDTYDETKDMYGRNGVDFGKIPKLPAPTQQAGPAAGGTIKVQIPGHPAGQIRADQKDAFLKKYPKAQVLQ